MNNKKIILFDGVCNFCSYWVNFTIKRDTKDLFRFATLQSSASKELTNKFNIDISNLDTFILIDGDKVFTKSTAALKVCGELTGLIKILYPLILLPEFFRDFIYNLIAKHRYKFFGKKDFCFIPEKSNKKFLE